jgi:phage protein U
MALGFQKGKEINAREWCGDSNEANRSNYKKNGQFRYREMTMNLKRTIFYPA